MPKLSRVTVARARRRVGLALIAAATALTARRARAVDPFEIQVYDGTANDRGAAGLELHVNTVASGVKESDPPELPQHHQTHFTLEPSFGLTPWWELGAYLQGALRADGHFDYAGLKLRSKFVTPPGFHPHARLGVNFEVSRLPDTYDRDRWGGELRPIAAYEDDRWILAINPIMDLPLAGQGFHDGPTIEPAAMVKRKLFEAFAIGVEYFGGFGPVAHLRGRHEQVHYLYEVVDLLAVDHLELNVGVGEGLTEASNGLVFKLIVGYTLDPADKKTVSALPRRWAHAGAAPR